MKAWTALAMIPFLGSLAEADSLGAAAKRERERREKKGPAPVKVIGDEELAAGTGPGAKGTSNPSAGSPSAGSASAPAPRGGARGGRSDVAGPAGATVTEVDSRRAAARQRLDAAYARISAVAGQLVEAVERYRRCQGLPVDSNSPTSSCGPQLEDIGMMAIAVGAGMSDAEEAARQGWLSPGEVRDARQRYGMEDTYWDKLVSLVAQYRR